MLSQVNIMIDITKESYSKQHLIVLEHVLKEQSFVQANNLFKVTSDFDWDWLHTALKRLRR